MFQSYLHRPTFSCPVIRTSQLLPFQLQSKCLRAPTLGAVPPAVGSSLPADLTPKPPALLAWAGSEVDPGEGLWAHRAPGSNCRRLK